MVTNLKLKILNPYLKTSFYRLILLVFVAVFLNSCSTEKNAFMNRGYHFVTVKFNGYFNGNEAYKLARKNIAEKHRDDYDELLDVYKFGNEILNKDEYDNLNRAMTKGVKMIDKHSMKFKVKREEVEVNKMIDDCYLLIGKARFLKYDFESAAETFTFIKQTYKESKEGYKANIWLVLAYIYQKKYVDAETEIKAIKENKKFPDKFKDDLNLVEAIYFKRIGKLDKAIPAFEKVITQTKKRKFKRRLQYILAQMYEAKGNLRKASDLYQIVAKKATDYDLQFNAKISLAETYEGSADDVVQVLEKMLKDAKNKEYFDQVYFALAKLYMRKGDEQLGVKNYKLSASSSVKNKKQKGKAFLALGDYYFEKKDYLNASDYYDSTLIALPPKYPSYQEISEKKNSLAELVKYLKIATEQDSLVRIAQMGEAERLDFINGKINEAKERAELLEIQQEAAREQALADAQVQGMNKGSWIFDSPTLLASAMAEFRSVWGDRALEDDWRRSDKTSLSINVVEQEIATTGVGAEIPEDQTIDYYLKALPLKPDQQEVAFEKVKNAYYQLGVLYRDNFNDLEQSTYYFNQLNKRFPNHSKEPVTLYQLYRNYDKMNNLEEQSIAKEKVLQKYPESEYAQLISNPNMLADQEQQEKVSEKKYEDLFAKFKSNDFRGTMTEISNYKPNLKEGELKARFDLLYAFSEGNLYGKDSLEFYLRRAYQDNMGTNVATEIDLILGDLSRKKDVELKQKMDSIARLKAFSVSESEPHYYVIIFNAKENKSEELENNLADFNKVFYSNLDLKVKSLAWSGTENAIIIKSFITKKDYVNYHETIKTKFVANKENIGDLYFPVSKSNYGKLFKYKEVLKYADFFNKQYTPRG